MARSSRAYLSSASCYTALSARSAAPKTFGQSSKNCQGSASCPVTATVFRRFAALKTALRRNGIAKSDIDLLIATTALDAGATLVTDDNALLAGDIPDLVVENWL